MPYDSIDFTPPQGVREEAARGLAWRAEHGRGGTAVGVARARDLSNGRTISPATARRMKAYFDRHAVDAQGQGWSPGETGYPSAGRIAHALWGGTPGRTWAEKLVRQMNTEDERSTTMPAIERRFFAFPSRGTDATKFLRVERRAAGDGEPRPFIVGYASLWGVPSLDGAVGEFTERVAPRAFSKALERQDDGGVVCRALWNHNDDYPLARYPTSLRLFQDAEGLGFDFPVSRASYAADLLCNIEDGIVQGNSYSFRCSRDSWSVDRDGRHIRTVEEVDELWDVGPVTYPAFGDNGLEVARRSFQQHLAAAASPPEPPAAAALRRAMERRRELTAWLKKHGAR